MKTVDRYFYFARACLLALYFSLSILQPVLAVETPAVPEVLEPWKEWVLHGKRDQILCIPRYNDALTYQCAWPVELDMDLNSSGGKFQQKWLVSLETWVALPGNSRHWPKDIRVDGIPVVVLEQEGVPKILLQPGSHTIAGEFLWSGLPEHIQIPRESGLLFLEVNNKHVQFPDMDNQGRLWLKRDRREEKIENRLKIESFRLIDDSVPARMLLHVSCDVAGSPRTVTLGPLYSPDRFTPVSLKSPLPAKLEPDGRMKVQVRPGRFDLRLDLRHAGPLQSMAFIPQENRFWPNQEIWSFRAQPDLRLVEIKNVSPVDPLQTTMPANWRKFPAYLVGPGSTMTFKQVKRGDPSPPPDQLVLDRILWLKFDGTGYTVQDRITGTKNTNWRLEMDPVVTLGSVVVDGREQLITRRKGSDKSGVELRNGQLNLTAESIFHGKISDLPATGWDHRFQKVSGRLHLPPGWKLINAKGMDNVSRTWIRQWTLLDFFIVLIFTIAISNLYSKKLAMIAFLTLVLSFHEPGAPKYVWFSLLIGFALLKYLPDSRFRVVTQFYLGAAALVFIVIVIPYSVQALRIGIYPQLEKPWTIMTGYRTAQQKPPARSRVMDTVQEMAPLPQKTIMKKKGEAKILSSAVSKRYGVDAPVMQYDPKALTQTGPGLPGWKPFETVRFSWSGPVTPDQTIRFTLFGPKTNLVLAFLRVFFIILLAMGMFKIQYRSGTGIRIKWQRTKMAGILILLFYLFPVPGQTAEIPPQHMLDQLEERLLEKDECFPSCASISDLAIHINPDQLSMELQIDAQVDTAVPVPGNTRQWLPDRVILDHLPAQGLFRKNNHFWLMVPKGRHRVTLKGPVRRQNAFQIPFNLKPKHLNITAEGWSVDGIHPDGTFDAQIQFKRILESQSQQKGILETGILPPFAQIERTIRIGLAWKVTTRIQRISPPGSGMVLNIPLLPGESITTRGIRVKDNVAQINFRSDQTELVWESFLEETGQIQLEHPPTDNWTEIWKVDVSPIFHMAYKGIPVIFHKTGSRWYPIWYPWPGERLILTISRPPGVEGRTLTIEKNHLELWPGRNTARARMDLSIKSSQGGQHIITLPTGARLQEVSIQGKIHPIRQNGRKVPLPITPGKQNIRLSWMSAQGMSTLHRSPEIDLGTQSVNSSVDIHLPRNRWPLFIGGELHVGPAVLFWSILIVILIVALGLSRTGWASLTFTHWFLLCMGLSMSHIWAGIFVVAWLVALDFRRQADDLTGSLFNLVQFGIVILTLAAAATLVSAISNGLLGHPDMSIRGNGSSASLLRWYHDVSGPVLPRTWVVSIPMLIYRMAMLIWALWVSFWLIGILKWGWKRFSTPRLWQKVQLRSKKKSKPDPEDMGTSK